MVFGRIRQYPLGSGDAPVGKKEIYFDICEELYVVQGKSLADIARTGDDYPSDRTLGTWRDEGEWDRKRGDFLKQNESLSSKLAKLKHVLVDEALSSKNPQTVYALAWLLRSEKAMGLVETDKQPESPNELSAETLRKVKEEIYGIIEENN